MRVAAGLVIEGIENPERRRAFLNGKPGNSARFVLHERQRRFQELCDFLFFAGLGLKGNVQRNLGHRSLLQRCLTRTDGMPARKWRIEISNWRPITVPLNEFESARLGERLTRERCCRTIFAPRSMLRPTRSSRGTWPFGSARGNRSRSQP